LSRAKSVCYNFFMLQKFYVILAIDAFILKDKKILIVKKSPYENTDAGLWTIPGGKIEKDKLIINALKREIKEEVNLEISKYQWLNEDVFESNDFWYHGQNFLCHNNNDNVKLEKKLIAFYYLLKDKIENFTFPKNIKKRFVKIFKKYV